MTKKQRELYVRYAYAPFNETIFTIYRKPSQNKINAYNNYMREVQQVSLKPNTIVSHKCIKGNCDFFSFAYFYMTINPDTGEVNYRLNYKTGKNTYDFDVTEEVINLTSNFMTSRLGI